MASYRIPAIDQFTFTKPEEWPRWIRRFERFRQASDLTSKSQETQISTLVYSMGDKAEDILQSFALTGEDAKKYDTVKAKFESHFVKTRNTIYERARSNRRKQEDSESADEFITDLYRLSEYCEYGTLHDELIRDRIVVGIRDDKLSEKLQLDAKLTLESAIAEVRQSELVKKQQAIVRGDTAVDGVKSNRRPRGGPRSNYKPAGTLPKLRTCTRCGKSPPHGKPQCPAREATCQHATKKDTTNTAAKPKGVSSRWWYKMIVVMKHSWEP